jgi:POT family proton-dependent oligopeptide transporter
LKDAVDGFGMTESEASDLYGTFIAFVFLTPFIGGLLADRVLGYRLSINIGGLMMGAGYCLMAVHDLNTLYIAMFLVIMGNGFFKPNISSLLGNLYNNEQYKNQKDEGYNIFYMGINIGAFVCNFFGAALYNMLGWGAAFMAAGVGMFVGLAIFWFATKHIKEVDIIKPRSANDMPLLKIFGVVLLPALTFGVIGYFLPEPIIGSHSTDAFLFGCIPVIFFYGNLLYRAPAEEKKPMAAMLAIFSVVIAFWAVFKQNGSTLNTWADRYTDREIPAAMVSTMSSLQLVDTVTYSKDSIVVSDNQFRVKDKKLKEFAFPSYFKNMPEENLPKEGSNLYLFNTNLFQSVNPFWVIITNESYSCFIFAYFFLYLLIKMGVAL